MEEPQYFKYLNRPKRKKKFKKFFAALIIIICAIGMGVLLFWGISAMEGKEMPWKGKLFQPVKTAEPTPLPTPAPTKTPAPAPTKTPAPEGVSGSDDIRLSEETLGLLKEGKRSPVKVKGIYVTGPKAGSEGMDSLIGLVEETELNAMVIDIKNDSGEITYKMDLDSAREINATVGYIRDIDALVTKLKEKDIYLIARIVAFKDPILAENREECSLKNKDGSLFRDKDGLAWVNPYSKEVWDYLIAIAKKAVELGFDEIQFDYIRFSTDSGMKDVDFGKDADRYSKEEIISGFTRYAYEQLMPLGVYVSADVYGAIISSTSDAGIVGQNYPQMARCLDYICPMIYPSHYSNGSYGIEYPDTEPYKLIRKALEDSKGKLAADTASHQAIVRPWLQDFTATWVEHHITYDAKELRDQIEAVSDAGYEEWILWNGASRYTEGGLLQE